jgi:hypothetical protein
MYRRPAGTAVPSIRVTTTCGVAAVVRGRVSNAITTRVFLQGSFCSSILTARSVRSRQDAACGYIFASMARKSESNVGSSLPLRFPPSITCRDDGF